MRALDVITIDENIKNHLLVTCKDAYFGVLDGCYTDYYERLIKRSVQALVLIFKHNDKYFLALVRESDTHNPQEIFGYTLATQEEIVELYDSDDVESTGKRFSDFIMDNSFYKMMSERVIDIIECRKRMKHQFTRFNNSELGRFINEVLPSLRETENFSDEEFDLYL